MKVVAWGRTLCGVSLKGAVDFSQTQPAMSGQARGKGGWSLPEAKISILTPAL